MYAMVEVRAERPVSEIQRLLESEGARLPRGLSPVPMAERTLVFSVEVDGEETLKRLADLPEVLEVYGTPTVAPFK